MKGDIMHFLSKQSFGQACAKGLIVWLVCMWPTLASSYDYTDERDGLSISWSLEGGGNIFFSEFNNEDEVFEYYITGKDDAFFPITEGVADFSFEVGGRDVINVDAGFSSPTRMVLCSLFEPCCDFAEGAYGGPTKLYGGNELVTGGGYIQGGASAYFFIWPGSCRWAGISVYGYDLICHEECTGEGEAEVCETVCVKDPGTEAYLNISVSIFDDTSEGPEENPEEKGGKEDNENTEMEGGEGAGRCGGGMPNYWVNTNTLGLVVVDTDFYYQALGPRIAMTHTWNSDPRTVGSFGRGWSFSYDSRVYANSGGFARLIRGSGQEIWYNKESSTTADGVTTTTYSPYVVNAKGDILTGYESAQGKYYLLKEKGTRWTYRYSYTGTTGSIDNYLLGSITDRNGRVVAITRNDDGTIAWITDAAGRKTTFVNNGNGLITSMITPYGDRAFYSYDGNGNLISSTDLEGATSTYSYNADHFITAIAACDKMASFTYTTAEGGWRIASFTNAANQTTTYSVDANGDRLSTNAAGQVTRFVPGKGGTAERVNPAGDSFTKDYTSEGFLTSTENDVTDSSYEYDDRGNLTAYTDGESNSWTFTYDADDNLLTVTNPLDQTTSYTWDGKGNFTSVTTPGGAKTQYRYYDNGLLERVTDPTGSIYRYGYDNLGNLVTFTDPLNRVTTFTYDSQGIKLESFTDPRGNTTSYRYDDNGRMWEITYPDGARYQISYDHCAAVKLLDPTGQKVEITRDKLLAIKKVTNNLNQAWSYGYDQLGLLSTITDPLGQVTHYTRDASGRLTKIKNPSGKEVSFSWTGATIISELTDQLGHKSTFSYDNNGGLNTLGFPEVMTTPPGGIGPPFPMQTYISWTRDELGRVTQKTNGRNQTIDYTYNSEGRLATEHHGQNQVAAYTYNQAGWLTRLVDPTGSTTFTRDVLHRITSITYPNGLVLSLTYDEAGNISTLTYPGGFVVSYTYNNRNWPVKASWTGGGWASLSYDQAGRITQVDRSNGTSTYMAHDGAKRLSLIDHRKGDASFARVAYTRNASGHITKKEILSSITPSVAEGTWAFTYDEANQLKAGAGNDCTMDSDGNLTGWGSGFSANYDARNRPTQIKLNGVTTDYQYTGMGWRWQETSNNVTKRYHYDPWGRLFFMANTAGSVVERYIYLGGLLVAWSRANGNDYFFHGDQNGNVLSVTSDAGLESAAYVYSPYGKLLGASGSLGNPFTYVGQFGVMDQGDGLYYMKNRYYLADLHRFLQRDPILYTGGTNLYAYVGGNPVSKIDPYGLYGHETIVYWFRQGYEVVGKKLISKTISSEPVDYIALRTAKLANHLYATTGSFSLSGKSVVSSIARRGAAEVGASCMLVGGITLGGAYLGGKLVEAVGEDIGSPTLQAAGQVTHEATTTLVTGAGEALYQAVRGVPYFIHGLGEKVGSKSLSKLGRKLGGW
jgi:RHS repeat-associated protein